MVCVTVFVLGSSVMRQHFPYYYYMLGVYKNSIVQAYYRKQIPDANAHTSTELTLYFTDCHRWKRCSLNIIWLWYPQLQASETDNTQRDSCPEARATEQSLKSEHRF